MCKKKLRQGKGNNSLTCFYGLLLSVVMGCELKDILPLTPLCFLHGHCLVCIVVETQCTFVQPLLLTPIYMSHI